MKRLFAVLLLVALTVAPAFGQTYKDGAITIIGSEATATTTAYPVADTTAVIIPATACTVEVVSSSTDDASAGTGVKTARVYGLDSSYSEITEDFTLDGTTTAVGVTSFTRINGIKALTAGTGGVAAGSIDVRDGSGNIYGRISAGYTESQSAIYTVPAGKFASLTSYTVSSVTNPGKFQLKARANGGLWRLIDAVNVSGEAVVNLKYPTIFDPKTDIIIYGASTTGNAAQTATFQLKLNN